MFANALPGEAKNSIAEFSQIQAMFEQHSPRVHVQEQLNQNESPDEDRFSHRDFRVIKLLERLLVELPSGRRVFFPYEIQILTKQHQEGQNAHNVHNDFDRDHVKYVNRLIIGARERLFSHFPGYLTPVDVKKT